MSWHSGRLSANSHVKVHNASSSPIVVFSFNYVDAVYVSYRSKAELQHGETSVLKAVSGGAGKITIGVAVGVARESGGGFLDWSLAVASADICQGVMNGRPRYKLRLRNVADNTECSIGEDNNGSLQITGDGVSNCKCGDSTEIEGASGSGMCILRVIQGVAQGSIAPVIVPVILGAKAIGYGGKQIAAAAEKKVQKIQQGAKDDVLEVVEKAQEALEQVVEKACKDGEEVAQKFLQKAKDDAQELVRETEARVEAAKQDLFTLSLVSALVFSSNVYLCRVFDIDASLGVAVASLLTLLWLKRDAITAATSAPKPQTSTPKQRKSRSKQ